VVEIEQPVHLWGMDAELAGEIGLAGVGLDHGAIKLELRGYDGRKRDKALPAAGHRWSGNFRAGGNSALQRRGDGIGGAHECIGRVLAERGDFRQIRSGHKDRSVIVSCELHAIAQHVISSGEIEHSCYGYNINVVAEIS
jgi:hypothetical protein